MYVATVGSKHLLLLGKVFAVRGDHAFRVEHDDVLYLSAQCYIQLCAADGSGTSAIYHDLYFCNVFASNLKRVLQSCCRDDGGAMLVVVHHRNVERFLQSLFNIETFGGLDVFKVDATEGRSNLLYCLAEFLRIFLGNFNVEDINATVNLKQ